jgi:hypothetical protein
MVNVGIGMPILTLDGGLMFVEELRVACANRFVYTHISQNAEGLHTFSEFAR